MRLTGSRAYTRPAAVPKMPPGLVKMMEGLTKDVLKNNPTNIYQFCASHFEKLLEIRDGPSSKRSLTLEEKIFEAQEKVRQRAKERQQCFDSEVQSHLKHKEDENIDSGVEGFTEQELLPNLRAPVHHDEDLSLASEVEISHEPFIDDALSSKESTNEPEEIPISKSSTLSSVSKNTVIDFMGNDQEPNNGIEDLTVPINNTDEHINENDKGDNQNEDKSIDEKLYTSDNDDNQENIQSSFTNTSNQGGIDEFASTLSGENSIANKDTMETSNESLKLVNSESELEVNSKSLGEYTIIDSEMSENITRLIDSDNSATEVEVTKIDAENPAINVKNVDNESLESLRANDVNDEKSLVTQATDITKPSTENPVESSEDNILPESVTYHNILITDVKTSQDDYDCTKNSDPNESSVQKTEQLNNINPQMDVDQFPATKETNEKEPVPESIEKINTEYEAIGVTANTAVVFDNNVLNLNDDQSGDNNSEIRHESFAGEENINDNENKETSIPKTDSADNNYDSSVIGSDLSKDDIPRSDDDNGQNMDLETAAVTIQKVFRSFLFKSRNSTFEDITNDDAISLEEDTDKKEEYFAAANLNQERRPLGITRMDTVLQTVNEEKSLSLSTDDSSTLSSAATTIQAHIRGFLVRNRLNSSKTVSTNSLVNSNDLLDPDTDQQKSKTVLNIHIVPEEGNYLSRDESLITSMDLSLDGSPPSSINLHPLSHDLVSERRKLLKREDAIQSVSPPSNNSGKLSEESIKEVLINESDVPKTESSINEKEVTAVTAVAVYGTINEQDDPKPTETQRPMSPDEADVITPFAESPRSLVGDLENTPKLVHSGEFHDVVLPTKVSRSDTTVVRGE